MPTDPLFRNPLAWDIQPATHEHVEEISRWIRSMRNGRAFDTQVIASSLSQHLQMDKHSDYVQHRVGIRNGQLLFYFNGHTKDRIGIVSKKVHKRKDYSVSLLVNTTVEGYENLSGEIWLQVLKWVFSNTLIGRVITELDETDSALLEAIRRIGFQPMDPAECPPSRQTWYTCDRLDFAPFADL